MAQYVTLPVNCDTVCQSLPRPPESSGIIMLKLKRKLKYHGHQYYESVRPAIVYDAFDYLRNNKSPVGIQPRRLT